MERLTKRAPNGLAYLAKVKQDEQAVEGSYNTLKCIQEAFEALEKYEEREESGELIEADTAIGLLEEAAEEIENCYGTDTLLSDKIRNFLCDFNSN